MKFYLRNHFDFTRCLARIRYIPVGQRLAPTKCSDRWGELCGVPKRSLRSCGLLANGGRPWFENRGIDFFERVSSVALLI